MLLWFLCCFALNFQKWDFWVALNSESAAKNWPREPQTLGFKLFSVFTQVKVIIQHRKYNTLYNSRYIICIYFVSSLYITYVKYLTSNFSCLVGVVECKVQSTLKCNGIEIENIMAKTTVNAFCYIPALIWLCPPSIHHLGIYLFLLHYCTKQVSLGAFLEHSILHDLKSANVMCPVFLEFSWMLKCNVFSEHFDDLFLLT